MKENYEKSVTTYSTHYSYLGGPHHFRKIEKLFDLSDAGLNARRTIIHELLSQGEYLAECPHGYRENVDMQRLERFLDGELDDA